LHEALEHPDAETSSVPAVIVSPPDKLSPEPASVNELPLLLNVRLPRFVFPVVVIVDATVVLANVMVPDKLVVPVV
jgi:hypothetical protein